jgi:glucokinase
VTEIVAADIGGTNARFARATIDGRGAPVLGTVRKYKVSDYPSLTACWEAFVRDEGAPLPDKACIAFATAVDGDTIKLTNSSWVIRPANLARDLGLKTAHLVNDFEAISHGISRLGLSELPLLFGQDHPLPETGTVTILGPGTGLGVALLVFDRNSAQVIATEGGHLDFSPLDNLEDRILVELRERFVRVSNERVVSGPGLNNLYSALARVGREPIVPRSDAELWTAALDGSDRVARTALERLGMSYGAVAGDLALAQGAHTVVLAGGLSLRMRDFLVGTSGFYSRFIAKGRFEHMMRDMAIRLVTHPEIGLFGAAAAFREQEE